MKCPYKLTRCVGWLVMLALMAPPRHSVQASTQQRRDITISAFTTGANWPLYIAQEAGYYEKYGLKVKLAFGIQPLPMAMLVSDEAQMTTATLEQALLASSRDGSLTIIGSLFKKSLYALLARPDIKRVQDLKGKRVGVSQLSDSTYAYAVKIFEKYGLTPRDVQWVVIGTNARAAALTSDRIDATMLTAPSYFRLEEAGYRSLANINDFDEIYTPACNLFKTATIKADPTLPERLTKAHAEAVKRFYADKSFAVRAYLVYEKQNPADVERMYDQYASRNSFERIPYVAAAAVRYTLDHQPDPAIASQLKAFDFRKVFDNSAIDRLMHEHFFENLFGPEVRAEQNMKSKASVR